MIDGAKGGGPEFLSLPARAAIAVAAKLLDDAVSAHLNSDFDRAASLIARLQQPLGS
jgi:hypothetical protein